MQARTRILALVWLGLAFAGGVVGLWMGYDSMGNPNIGPLVYVFVTTPVIAFWTIPLAMASAGLARRRPRAWWVVLGYACLGCILSGLWLESSTHNVIVTATFPFPIGGCLGLSGMLARGHSLGMLLAPPIALALLALSACSVWLLRRDPPASWAQPVDVEQE